MGAAEAAILQRLHRKWSLPLSASTRRLPANGRSQVDTNERIHDFDDFALDMVNIKAAELVGKAGFTADDFEDIRQAMLVDLLERLKKYDPSKSSFKLFVTCVIDRKGQNLVRYRESDVRDYRREDCSLNEDIAAGDGETAVQRLDTINQDDQDIRSGKCRRPTEDRVHLRLDVQAVLEDLPPDLRRAAELLQTLPISHVARAMGVAHATFYENHMVRLREIFVAKGLGLYVAQASPTNPASAG